MIPLLLTQAIILFQDTSLVYVIGLTEFFGVAYNTGNRDGTLVEMLLFAGAVYFVISFQRLDACPDTPSETCLMISIKKISKWYGEFHVLKQCSTEVSRGEVVVVCGPSGSGKSTLIKCVNGLEVFQEGEILVDGMCQ